jgi:hypothetical protein
MRKPGNVNSLRQADAESGADAAESKSSRKTVSKREFLKADGSIADRMEESDGARYTLLDPAGNHDLDYQFGANPNADKWFANFGFHTKVGNVANTVLNDKDEPGTPGDAAAAIKEFLAGIAAGTWAERAAGGIAVRIDKDALAGSIVAVAESKGKTADYQKIRDKLESDPQYVRAARQVPEVATEYAKRVGKPAKSVDDLLD